MGGLTSKHLDDLVDNSKSQGTPKMVKHIPFDPRSPSDHITRTPIIALDTTDSGVDTTPSDAKTVRIVDPRSPNAEVSRTPIIVEKTEVRHRSFPIRPKTLMKLDSLSKNADDEDQKQDPRSPTTKVPRTPLEDKAIELDPSQSKENENDETSVKDVSTKEDNGDLVKKLFSNDGPVDKVRRPLAAVQNKGEKTPRDLLQAKHCRNVEDEYNKTHQCLLSKLPELEKTVQSNTEFVETI